MKDGEHAKVPNRIDSLHVRGFRSLADVKLDNIPNPMVLLGANGAGKSSVLRLFEMLREMFHHRFAHFILRRGGADDHLFGGRRQTRQIDTAVSFHTGLGVNELSFTLVPANTDMLKFASEEFHFTPSDGRGGLNYGPYKGGVESYFYDVSHSPESDWRARAAADFLRDCSHYQFHDTSSDSPIHTRWDVEDNHRLLAHGGNLASVLLRLREMDFPRYRLIRTHIKRVMPEFDDFVLEMDYGKTILKWRPQNTDKTMSPNLTSDGTLRCFCLVTLLNLPDEMLPGVILLDEPELGLHPFAVSLVSHMVRSLARKRQIIVATQSPHFVDAFSLDEIVVLHMRNGRTEANRLNQGDFSHWLEEYSTGELWWKNVFGGYP